MFIAMLFLDKAQAWIVNLDIARGFDKVGVELDKDLAVAVGQAATIHFADDI